MDAYGNRYTNLARPGGAGEYSKARRKNKLPRRRRLSKGLARKTAQGRKYNCTCQNLSQIGMGLKYVISRV